MSGIRIEGNTSGNVAEVNARHEVTVNLPADDAEQSGYAIMMCESDPGTVTGHKYVKSPEASEDWRLRVGLDTLLFTETFNYANQNTANFAYRNTIMTIVWGSGFITLNGSGITTLNSGCEINTYRTFSVYGAGATYCEFTMELSAIPLANWTFDSGLFLSNASNPYNPTDGVYFEITNAGLIGVMCYNGSLTQTGVLMSTAVFGTNTARKLNISIDERHCEFWVDDVLYAELDTPAGQGQPMSSSGAPWAARLAIPGTAAGSVAQVKISDVTASMADWHTSKPWSAQNCGQGLMAYQGQSGGTMGTTASYANSANPSPGAGSNTASALATGLGGQVAVNAAASGSTDLIMTSFQNPAGGTGQTPRVLYITGCKISSVNMGAVVAGTATTLAWSLALGHTALSLATTEGAAAKAPRRIALGHQWWAIGAVIGAGAANGDLYMKFDSPIVVNPGEYIATVAKFIVGTATGSQAIWSHVTFDGYFA